MFAAMSNVGGWTMGNFDGSQLHLWQWAREYTLADNFFMGAFGGSFFNHQWLICACAPRFPEAPEAMHVHLDPDGKLTKKPGSPSAKDGAVELYSGGIGGQVTPDGFAVNTTQPPYQPSGVAPAPGGNFDLADPKGNPSWNAPLPPQQAETIGDTLSAKGVSWAWYAGGFNLALADGRRPPEEKRKIIYTREDDAPYFTPHHQPFNYHLRFAPGTPDRALHLKDGDDLLRDIDQGTLPSVAFYKPVGRLTQHPSYTDLVSGDAHLRPGLPRPRGHRLALCKAGVYRQDRLRHQFDPQIDHAALWAGTACRRARANRRSDRGVASGQLADRCFPSGGASGKLPTTEPTAKGARHAGLFRRRTRNH